MLREITEPSLSADPLDPVRLEPHFAARVSPVVEGDRVTVLWRGKADAVRFAHTVFGLSPRPAFTRVGGGDRFAIALEFPRGSRFEYRLEIERGGGRREILDPWNPLRARDPFGEHSVGRATGYSPPDWARPDPGVPAGKLEELRVESPALGREVPVRVYLPAGLRRSPRCPLLVAHDGFDFVEYAGLRTVLDNLIHRGEVPPLVAALTQSRRRLTEYADHPAHAAFLADDLLPRLEREFPIRRRAGARGLLGASFGAVAALSAAWRRPRSWGLLCLLSGSFATEPAAESGRGSEFDRVVRFVKAFREQPGRPAERVFLGCGRFESLIREHRAMVPVLEATGMAVRSTESLDGHSWENWRDRLGTGLAWLYGT